jgi:hypothetical protein
LAGERRAAIFYPKLSSWYEVQDNRHDPLAKQELEDRNREYRRLGLEVPNVDNSRTQQRLNEKDRCQLELSAGELSRRLCP